MKKINKSTLKFWWPSDDNGGYTVHPVPDPVLIIFLRVINTPAGISNQNLRLFNRGNDKSADINIIGKK